MNKRYKKLCLEKNGRKSLYIPRKGYEYEIFCDGEQLIVKEVVNVDRKNEEPFFLFMSDEKRKEVKKWYSKQEANSKKEKKFLKIVKEGLQTIDYEYYIATIEPAINCGKIQYIKNADLTRGGYSTYEWYMMAKEYNPERKSRQATLYELFLWYAWRVVKGYWSLEFIAKNSSSGGNYWNSPEAIHDMEKAGVRTCGGFADGQGNTYKLVTYKGHTVAVGGSYFHDGRKYTVTDVDYECKKKNIHYNAIAVVVLLN